MKKHLVIGALLLLGSTSISAAQWITSKQGGEFDDDPTYIAVVGKGDYGLAFRCNSTELKIILITPEKVVDIESLKLLSSTEPKLRVRIDGGAIIDLPAALHEANGKLGVVADASAGLLEAVGSAKSRVAVVLSALGQLVHETTFGVGGSAGAAKRLIRECRLSDIPK